ncbi:MAG: dTDP-4-dehydrorhamnose reductase [Thermoplasmatales archaeon]|nr:dTDP-4-dehydrorhamnose reductase [Thermoplasmatales archaeon]
MKVAIIGAKGQLGSDIAKEFGEDAIPLTHEEVEVTNLEGLKILKEIKPDTVINTAAFHKVDDCEVYPEKTFNVNTFGAYNVAKICNEIDAINVYISTDFVFDGRKKEPYTEEDIPNPINIYGISKYGGEIITCNYSKKYYVIRVASLYGKAGASGKGGNFVNNMIKKANNKEPINVVDDIIMSPTYTKDVAVTLKKFLDIEPSFGIYHMVNNGFCSWYEFAKKIFEIMEMDIKVNPIKSDQLKLIAKRPLFSALKNKKIEKIGLKMPDWEDALKRYIKEDLKL